MLGKRLKIILVLGIFFLAGLFIGSFFVSSLRNSTNLVANFIDCEKSGGLILESYPRQCKINDQSFVEEIIESVTTDEYIGIIKLGSELDSKSEYCPNGFYLVSNNLPLGLKEINLKSNSLDLSQFLNREIKLSGKYTKDKAMCLALICECEDYLEIIDIF